MTNRFNFTKASISALPVPACGRAEYYDSKAAGLQIRVTAQGVKTFCVYKRVKGSGPERITVGRFPEVTVEQARKAAAQVVAAIAGGANPAEAKRAHRGELIFKELFHQYMERHAKVKKKTATEDEQRFEQYLRPLARRKLSAIDRHVIAKLHSDITAAGHPTVANRILALISSVFGRAVEWGIIDTNPAKGIRRNREHSRDRFLQSDELPRFFSAVASEPNGTIRDYILVSLLTGARRANVLRMQWKDINLTDGIWRIAETKNGTPQNLPLTVEAIRILSFRKEEAGESPYVFPGEGKDGHLVEPRKGWLRVLEKARLEDLRLHDLRRTLGSWQAKTGASLAIIGKSLNQKSQQATAIYARLDLDPVRASLEKATSAILLASGLENVVSITRGNPDT